MQIEYDISMKELMESLSCLEKKKKIYKTHIIILILLGVGGLWEFYKTPDNLVIWFVTVLIMLSLFAIIYLPVVRRMKKAKNILKTTTSCSIEFPIVHIQKIYKSNNVITIQCKEQFYSIPMRSLSEVQYRYIEKNVFDKDVETNKRKS